MVPDLPLRSSHKKGPPGRPDGPSIRFAVQNGRRESFLSSVLSSVASGVSSVLNCFTGVVDGVASSVERIVNGDFSSVHVALNGVFDRNVLNSFLGLGFARGQAEREDRNGQCNLLHDRSIPCL